MEVAVDYSYARYNPSHVYVPSSYSLNGGGGSFLFNFAKYVGIKADFQGYGSNQQNFNIPAGSTICPAGCAGNVQANLFTYTFGPRIGLNSGKFRPFGQALFGGAHSNFAGNLYRDIGNTTVRPAGNAVAMEFGGGLDIVLNHSGTIAFRPAEINYMWTNFGISGSGQSGQSNFQYKAGIVFNF
jgi:hypothetical protein